MSVSSLLKPSRRYAHNSKNVDVQRSDTTHLFLTSVVEEQFDFQGHEYSKAAKSIDLWSNNIYIYILYKYITHLALKTKIVQNNIKQIYTTGLAAAPAAA